MVDMENIEIEIMKIAKRIRKKREFIFEQEKILKKYKDKLQLLKNQQITGINNPKVIELIFKQSRDYRDEFDEIILCNFKNEIYYDKNEVIDQIEIQYNKEKFHIIEIEIYQEYYDVEISRDCYTVFPDDLRKFLEKLEFQKNG